MKKKCDFTLRHYKEIIREAKKNNFIFSSFTKKPTSSKKRIYMRHDVDISLKNALEVAKLEKKGGVVSSFFIRTHSSFYNPLSKESLEIIKKIISLGHKIGLHYDGEIKIKRIEKDVENEYKFLNKFFLIGKVVSFHRPNKNKKVLNLKIKNFINTYSPEFFKKIEYISDSNRQLKKGCILEFIKKTKAKNIQVLTHSFWWNQKSLGLKDLYKKLLKTKEKELKEELKKEIKAYQNISL